MAPERASVSMAACPRWIRATSSAIWSVRASVRAFLVYNDLILSDLAICPKPRSCMRKGITHRPLRGELLGDAKSTCSPKNLMRLLPSICTMQEISPLES
ncbi:hypothetical protein BD310DRAFT_923695 [Dichomitus squalens]|uniref:Uncharacterized protein n=1 Tax=Dichomitus squalens TaxID=114155 RepID=A0A4Q9PZD8_9APHY|nr:hypothetical protein BD310DRAFT_923695 [Dichomitus squalens]